MSIFILSDIAGLPGYYSTISGSKRIGTGAYIHLIAAGVFPSSGQSLAITVLRICQFLAKLPLPSPALGGRRLTGRRAARRGNQSPGRPINKSTGGISAGIVLAGFPTCMGNSVPHRSMDIRHSSPMRMFHIQGFTDSGRFHVNSIFIVVLLIAG